jgi:hypothetical protein
LNYRSHPLSPETRAKISAAMMGHAVSAETRARLSAANMGHAPTGPKHQSIKAWAKISASRMGRKASLETRTKMSAVHMGHILPDVTKAALLAANWKGGRVVWKRKQKAKRRLLGFVSLNKSFTGCEGHHVDNERVIYMPKELHRSIYHRQTDGRGMAEINAVAYNFLFK